MTMPSWGGTMSNLPLKLDLLILDWRWAKKRTWYDRVPMAGFGQKWLFAVGSAKVRLQIEKETFEPIAAPNDPFVGYVGLLGYLGHLLE